eukprot:TRINITY_DN12223_c0_g1_i1.p1 TRINITY_DN12223_c0_g1~~TRINITY_DN12223_c0_g1_i1.p1  ORF type:complete len:318 (-),score=44.88 TRINITY_DN12223_c0_g1_i1:336-1289(-)
MEEMSARVRFNPAEAVARCPFLRNVGDTSGLGAVLEGVVRQGLGQAKLGQGHRGPIFEDGPSFEMAFTLFHGSGGIVPLVDPTLFRSDITPAPTSSRSHAPSSDSAPHAVDRVRASRSDAHARSVVPCTREASTFQSGLAASAASISLSGFAQGFGYEAFRAAQEAEKRAANDRKRRRAEEKAESERKKQEQAHSSHEVTDASEWLATGNCPIAKSFRALSTSLPLVAKALTPSPELMKKYSCPPAIVAARAALSKQPAVKALRPQALPVKVLAVGALGLGVNFPLGMLREHTEKFSFQWILAVHAAVPFVAMMRKG